ncbi:MAG: Lrp/AsnC family transcriptional regulator [Candidatus Aenigmarchaeota archaeon]|nr:Lrp/AsnC family transcriptional regulator [Candidatus Aenigmarchaeota archaeon]
MNQKDVRIFACLRQNGRMPISKLSKQTGMPVSTIFDHLRTNPVIQRHVTLLDFQSLGFSTKAIVLLRANKNKQELYKYLSAHFNINNLCKITNGYDYCFECVFKNMSELEKFLDTLEERFELKSKNVHYIINEIKREAFLSDPNTCELILNA